MESNITQIGKYQISGVLGRGAMGIVYRGFDPVIRRQVAIKTIACPQMEDAKDELYLRFQREAQAAGNLNHPNIVSIYEYGEESGLAYIAMEHVEGRSLADRMKQGESPDVAEATKIIKHILSALTLAHSMGVVHRDIKPANIMIAKNGDIKVADFGIARIESSDLTQAGAIIGTPGYMSPEQLKGEPIDARSDLFSAGVILYEMLTGQKAFPGDTFASVIYNVINKELPPPSELRRTVPAGLDEVVSRAVAKSMDGRFESARQFLDAIDSALGKNTVQGAVAAHAGRDHMAAFSPVSIQERSGKGRAGLWLGLGGLAVLAALALFFEYRPVPQGNTTAVQAQLRPGDVIQDCETCPSLVVVPPGQFVQGSPSTQAGATVREGPVRLVSVGYSLAVGRHEVTRGQYARFVADTGHSTGGCDAYDGQWMQRDDMSWENPGFIQEDTHPVTCVSWNDAQAYVRWLSRTTGHEYRLLSASEWEYAARDGGRTSGNYSADANTVCQEANVADRTASARYNRWQVFDCQDDYVHTAPVGSFAPNTLGIFDMAGNVFEWVTDCWNDSYKDAPADGKAWMDGDCTRHVLRGGSWFSPPGALRATFRNSFPADYRGSSFGFRVTREIAEQKGDG